jgi:hypothetical protein
MVRPQKSIAKTLSSITFLPFICYVAIANKKLGRGGMPLKITPESSKQYRRKKKKDYREVRVAVDWRDNNKKYGWLKRKNGPYWIRSEPVSIRT